MYLLITVFVIEYDYSIIIELDVKVKLLVAGTTQEKLGETIGTTGQYVNHILKKNNEVVNKTFVKMMEALGYDIQLVYVKR